MSSVEVENVTKYFGASQVVGSISFRVEPGEFVSLLGPSGCGKTTTLRMIAGFEEPTSGIIRIADRVSNDVPIERRGVGLVFQSYALFPHLTVAENVAFGLRLRSFKKSAVSKRVSEMLELVGLNNLGSRMPRQISGGQQQRVALARALAVSPSILLFDEPLSNLDLKLREQMRDEIRRLQRHLGTTAIYVTHDQGEAMAMSDRIAVMNNGLIDQIDTPSAIYERPSSLFVARFIGQCNALPGKYGGYANGYHQFVSNSGTPFSVRGEANCESWEIGRPLTLVFRPEAVQIGVPHAPQNYFNASVEDAVYLGEKTSVTIAMGAGRENVTSSSKMPRGSDVPRTGDVLSVVIPPDECVLVDEVEK